MASPAPPVILVADDNDDNFLLLRCAFESARLPHRLIGVANGFEATCYLCADEPYHNRSEFPFPDLLLLDLEMPIMDGFEVLAALKDQPEFQHLPVVVLSSMDEPEAMERALKLGARDYLVKPTTMHERIEMVHRLHAQWLAGKDKNTRQRPGRNPGPIPCPNVTPRSQ
jgi:CheY-like chemotaxis protein